MGIGPLYQHRLEFPESSTDRARRITELADTIKHSTEYKITLLGYIRAYVKKQIIQYAYKLAESIELSQLDSRIVTATSQMGFWAGLREFKKYNPKLVFDTQPWYTRILNKLRGNKK